MGGQGVKVGFSVSSRHFNTGTTECSLCGSITGCLAPLRQGFQVTDRWSLQWSVCLNSTAFACNSNKTLGVGESLRPDVLVNEGQLRVVEFHFSKLIISLTNLDKTLASCKLSLTGKLRHWHCFARYVTNCHRDLKDPSARQDQSFKKALLTYRIQGTRNREQNDKYNDTGGQGTRYHERQENIGQETTSKLKLPIR